MNNFSVNTKNDIPEINISKKTREIFGCCPEEEKQDLIFMSTKKFYKDTIAIQREKVNNAIEQAINAGCKGVNLSFTPFSAIINEIKEAGWMFEDNKFNNTLKLTQVQITQYERKRLEDKTMDHINEDENSIIGPEEFYQRACQAQIAIITENIKEAMFSGLTEVRLSIEPFSSLEEEMKRSGWRRSSSLFGQWYGISSDEQEKFYSELKNEAE